MQMHKNTELMRSILRLNVSTEPHSLLPFRQRIPSIHCNMQRSSTDHRVQLGNRQCCYYADADAMLTQCWHAVFIQQFCLSVRSSVCLSVHLSPSCIVSKRLTQHIIILSSAYGSPIILHWGKQELSYRKQIARELRTQYANQINEVVTDGRTDNCYISYIYCVLRPTQPPTLSRTGNE